MAGYIRQDVSNNISNGSVVDADDLDGEFDAIVTAFNTSTGHKHDGTSAEGAPITVVGPAQDVSVSAAAVIPKTDNTYDLGTTTLEFKDLYLGGTADVNILAAETSATVAGVPIVTTTATQTLTNKTINLANNTFAATSAQLAAALTDETGTGSVVFSVSPALTGTPTAPTAAAATNTTQLATTAHVFAERTNTATLTNKTLSSPTISGGTINGATVGATTAASGSFSTLTLGGGVITSTAAELNTLDGFTGTASGLNTAVSHFVPSGGIILWSGSVVSIPSGWALCDGTSGTPNLRDRFVVGAGSTYAVGATGGAASVTLTTAELPSHTHTGTTDSAGAHNHTYTRYETIGNASGSDLPSNRGALTRNTSTEGAHTHSFTTASTGSGESHENRPPYYALAYIMKL